MRASTLRRRITALPGTKKLCAFEPKNDDDGDYDGDDQDDDDSEDDDDDDDDTADYHGDDFKAIHYSSSFLNKIIKQ